MWRPLPHCASSALQVPSREVDVGGQTAYKAITYFIAHLKHIQQAQRHPVPDDHVRGINHTS